MHAEKVAILCFDGLIVDLISARLCIVPDILDELF